MDKKVSIGTMEEDQGREWGKSLPVPSVQEIVRKDANSIPERYIREHVDKPRDADLSTLSSDIPVIDFSLLSRGHEGERRKLDQACKDWGFFQIINHGVAEDILQRIRNAMAGFFSLPLAQKMDYSMATNNIEGYGQAYVVSEEQKLDWNDIIFLMTLPPEVRNPKYWPTVVPDFRHAVDKYAMELNRVTVELLGSLSLMMNMDRDKLLELHGVMKQAMRMNYYPTCNRPDLVLGVSPHSDGGSITILLQDDDITGLQIKYRGEWFAVKPIPNALVVNIGDVIEAWSNGMYKSIEHRAVTNDKTARMSLATFVVPNEDVEIGPLHDMVDSIHRPKMYKTMTYLEYIRHTLRRAMGGKAHTHILKLGNECQI